MTSTVRTVPFVDLASQHDSIRDEIDEAINAVLSTHRFILGPELEGFEADFAEYLGLDHCIGVGSGTDALILALRACGVGAGDEVITPSHTFFAGPLAIAMAGAVPVFVDVDPATDSVDVERAAQALSSRTRAVIPVHLYGRCADLSELMALAEEHGLWVIEDAAQAHGARANGQLAGTTGHLGCFSFYPSKNLGAFGDAGAVVTHDPVLADRLRLLRNYGQTRKYEHKTLGTNSRLDDLQAAILRRKLRHLDEWNTARQRAAATYADLLDPAVQPPTPTGSGDHVFHLYVVRVQHRAAVQTFLSEHGVETQIHYPVPVHRQLAFQHLHHVAHDLRVTERLAGEVLSLPMFPTISMAEITYVADILRGSLTQTIISP